MIRLTFYLPVSANCFIIHLGLHSRSSFVFKFGCCWVGIFSTAEMQLINSCWWRCTDLWLAVYWKKSAQNWLFWQGEVAVSGSNFVYHQGNCVGFGYWLFEPWICTNLELLHYWEVKARMKGWFFVWVKKKKSFWLGDEKCRSSNAMKYQFMILINLLLGSTHKTGRSIDVNITSEVVHDSEQSKDLLSCEWIFSAGNLGYSTGIQLCTKKSP